MPQNGSKMSPMAELAMLVSPLAVTGAVHAAGTGVPRWRGGTMHVPVVYTSLDHYGGA